MDVPVRNSLAPPTIRTLADLLVQLGGIPAERVRVQPPPGTGTEADLLEIERRENRPCELVDGVLVEKPSGFRESLLAMALGAHLRSHALSSNLGLVTGPDGMLKLFPGLVRIPDVAYISWERIPGGQVPDDPIPQLVPDLVAEILSQSNTASEMDRKCEEYFTAGVRRVWLIDSEKRQARVRTSQGGAELLADDDVLGGADVLPGFQLRLGELFAELDRKGRG